MHPVGADPGLQRREEQFVLVRVMHDELGAVLVEEGADGRGGRAGRSPRSSASIAAASRAASTLSDRWISLSKVRSGFGSGGAHGAWRLPEQRVAGGDDEDDPHDETDETEGEPGAAVGEGDGEHGRDEQAHGLPAGRPW